MNILVLTFSRIYEEILNDAQLGLEKKIKI